MPVVNACPVCGRYHPECGKEKAMSAEKVDHRETALLRQAHETDDPARLRVIANVLQDNSMDKSAESVRNKALRIERELAERAMR
jgi:hypothetical protein